MAIWDNRATQHYGIADFGNQQRELHRITLAGDVPVEPVASHASTITHAPIVPVPPRHVTHPDVGHPRCRRNAQASVGDLTTLLVAAPQRAGG